MEMKEQRKSGTSPLLLPLVLVAALLQQLVEDATLLQGSEVVDVLRDDGNVAALASTRHLAGLLIVGQRAEQRVVLVGGEVVPGERKEGEE